MKRSGNHDRINKLLFPDRLNLLKNLIIKEHRLCAALVRVIEERDCCRKAATEGTELLKENCNIEKSVFH